MPRTKKTSAARGSSATAARLAPYHRKRHFERTPEPDGNSSARALGAQLRFVVQAHAARQLHYDFRLELDGVLLSWSVPKGPSLQAGLRRLAVRTEDHPLDYADFEGVIPKGEYGGGTVIVWDRGTWTPEGDGQKTLAAGRMTFELHGEKLRGRFHLVRTRTADDKHENWLLFKGRDAGARDASDIVHERDESVISGRTLAQVAEQPTRVWHSNRDARSQPDAAAPTPVTRKPTKAKPTKTSPTKTKRTNDEPRAAEQTDTVALVKRLGLPFALTNLDKLLYPDEQLRKADIIAYYVTVARVMLPHVQDRPLTLVRCPNGYTKHCFYQKHANDNVPAAVLRVPIQETANSEPELYMAVRDLNGLVAMAQLGVLEIHTWGCHLAHVEQPDKLVFDLDPDPAVSWEWVVEAALDLRERLRALDLQSFVQTTGGKGLHVVAPVRTRLTWEQHKSFSLGIATALAKQHPDRYLTSMRKAERKGRIFLDYLRNGRGATAVAPYSTRARSGATVAAPISWEELSAGAKPADFNLRSMVERLSQPDPWQAYAGLKQAISAAALRSVKSR
jgi:bifunctional non-homologous end joining protein LigD